MELCFYFFSPDLILSALKLLVQLVSSTEESALTTLLCLCRIVCKLASMHLYSLVCMLGIYYQTE